ncbi:NAD(+) synthase [Blastopirellula sp. JC732]|uniref:Glutamine-dependent NAD(+) synthetase n=1 Tax=Blastopirellula sediminis TaxID=2894196 RepID=A0A9X1MIF3_9BACT|nr:NAD(+) synthase [Blastopirellula sediminis]MCC9607856.1 NAD(+) synthase [Blastopirellula sediminis]MCC9627351.1 NAD(+) synthase [Blastopirellula sediminis]
MKLVKVAAAVVNQTPLDWQGNRDRILGAIEEANLNEASILCLPELCITGYGCEDAFLSADVQRTALAVLKEIAPQTRDMFVTLGLPMTYRGVLYNVVAILADGEIVGFVPKQNLAGDGIHYEPRWFKPWPVGLRAEVEIDGREYPFGDLVFRIDDALIGLEICEDAWVADRPGSRQARIGVDIILNPSASHFAFGKHEIRQRFVLEGSRAFHASYVYANLLGNEAGRAIYDGDAMIATGGRMLAVGPRLSFHSFLVTTAVIDLDLTRMYRARSEAFRPDYQGSQQPVVHVPFVLPEIEPAPARFDRAEWEMSPDLKQEEFTRAVALGLYDYLLKSRSGGFVVSMSGGADSAATALLCSLSLRMAAEELGFGALKESLDFIKAAKNADSVEALIGAILDCVYQATRNSGQTTLAAARQVSDAIHAKFHHFHVDKIVELYTELGAQAIGRPLNWATDDIALQNIQARTRAPSVWLLANLRGSLLLSTSNRSEAAVGYATMDGDTSGGLCPIAGIDKAFLRKWLAWMETTGPNGFGPTPALNAINVQAPTAELRPQESGQTDEADLMPYDLLDAIERAAIRDKQSPLESYRQMLALFPQYDEEQLAHWIERFFKLWSRNQWKRERYAPSFHLDDENLDPKTWCRFPILSGGFERELAEMWRAVRHEGEEEN